LTEAAGRRSCARTAINIFRKMLSHSVNETLALGRRLSRYLSAGDIICLFGGLGSGKTVLTKGIAEGLGIQKARVISPTFVLIREHLTGRIPLYHFDLYRLESADEILRLGYEEYLYDDGLAVIEWADRLGCLLPKDYLKVELSVNPGSKRSIKFSASGARYQRLLKKVR